MSLSRGSVVQLAALALAVSAAACIEGPSGPVMTAWEGELFPVLPGSPTGTVAAVSEGIHTRAGIQIAGAEAGERFLWRLNTGTCQQPGSLVGGLASYPDLVASASGSATAEAVLSQTLSPSSSHHAVLLDAAGEELACGELTRLAPAS